MALRDIDSKGGVREVREIDFPQEFGRRWNLIPAPTFPRF